MSPSLICFQVLESYDRAYSNMVRVQQLAELEEVCIIPTRRDSQGYTITMSW